MCSSTQAAKGVEQWPAVIKNIVKLQAVADMAGFVTAANINQQDLRVTTLPQSRVISSFIKSPAGIYITYKENSTYSAVIEFLAVHFPLGCSWVERKIKIHFNSVYAGGFFRAMSLSDIVGKIIFNPFSTGCGGL